VIGERDAAGPTIAALTHWAEEVRRREVERTVPPVTVTDDPVRDRLDAVTRSLVRKLLHPAITHLRDNAEDPAVALFLRETFDLDETAASNGRVPRRRAGTGAEPPVPPQRRGSTGTSG